MASKNKRIKLSTDNNNDNNKRIKLSTDNNNDNNKKTKQKINEPWIFNKLQHKKRGKPVHKHYTIREKALKLSTPFRMVVSG